MFAHNRIDILLTMPAKFHKILVVDDDPVMVKLLESTLTDKGFDVMVTQEAADGLQKAINNKPDLIILDVMMPVINGFNFCRLLKSEQSRQDVPIILLTSRDEMEDIQIGLEMGADAYLTKPVNMDELFKTIKVVEGLRKDQ